MDLSYLPHSPGVYLMRNGRQEIIYIGKANDLKKRVASYFKGRDDTHPKIEALAALVRRVDYIPARSERDSLILERKLISRFKPFYNTVWKDDKSYPYVKLTTNEDYPRLLLTRKKKKDGARYFGPFSNVKIIRRLLSLWWEMKLFPLRPCGFEFEQKKITADGGLKASDPKLHRKVLSCIYLHTKDCPAPCVGRISAEDYGKIVRKVELFFSGDFEALRKGLEQEMKEASEKTDYERAARCRDQILALEHIGQKVKVRKTDEESVTKQTRMSRALTELKEALDLPIPPLRIECFDISNIQSAEPVASMVVFEGGQPLKSDYRKFKIKTVRGQNDFAMMGEAVRRRYLRVAQEGRKAPDLVLVDGGKGQLSAALQSLKELKNEGYGKALAMIRLASLAKQDEEVFLPGRENPLRLPKDSPALHILQHIRDEAHRFAVAFHRQRRNKAVFES